MCLKWTTFYNLNKIIAYKEVKYVISKKKKEKALTIL